MAKTNIAGQKYLSKILKTVFQKQTFTNSGDYWEERYKKGGNSGAGSYNNLAEFKGEIINSFVADNNVKNVIELGCGDGNQLRYFNFASYLGLDVSQTAVLKCREIFKSDPSKRFELIENYKEERAELVLSLDVIFHLIEDEIFEKYMKTLFDASDKFIIIYSSNREDNGETAAHFKHRRFTEWIDKNSEGVNNFV